jgi:hypothetical protein
MHLRDGMGCNIPDMEKLYSESPNKKQSAALKRPRKSFTVWGYTSGSSKS